METKNQPVQNNFQDQKKSQPVGLIVILIILLIAASVLTYVYIDLRKKSTMQAENIVDLELKKDSLELELTGLIEDYDVLRTDNDSMNALLEEQQNYIRKLIVKDASNKDKIETYQKELRTLREIMRSYIVQIDSLNTKNQELTVENIEIRTKLKTTENEKVKLIEEKDLLNSKVELASVLSAKNISALPLNKNSKERDKAKYIEKIKTCFTVRENAIVAPGRKEVFIRIIRPDGFLMTPSAENIFETKEESQIYSAKRELIYENKDIEICIFYDKTEEFVAGTYNVEIYTEGSKIGETTFTLK